MIQIPNLQTPLVTQGVHRGYFNIALKGGGRLTYIPRFIDTKEKAKTLYNDVHDNTPWQHGVYGTTRTPRLLWAYRDANAHVEQSYTITPCTPWLPSLEALRDRIVSEITHRPLTYAQVNYYRDGSDHIGHHGDREVLPGDVIASVSLGSPRRFVLRQRADPSVQYSITLENGSLLIMDRDAALGAYTHAVMADPRCESGRINITYRNR